MKEILEHIYKKEIEYFVFMQDISVYPKQYTDNEIYDTEVSVSEPFYSIIFKDGSVTNVELNLLLSQIFNNLKANQ
jgi:hypothetical protein